MDSHGIATWIAIQEGLFVFAWKSRPTEARMTDPRPLRRGPAVALLGLEAQADRLLPVGHDPRRLPGRAGADARLRPAMGRLSSSRRASSADRQRHDGRREMDPCSQRTHPEEVGTYR